MSELLSVTGLSKAYSGVSALEGVDLSLAAGEVHALMGENGAGKSTLIKCLAGVVTADVGQWQVHGQPVRIAGPQDSHRLGLRFIHQELNVVGHLSVAENIFLGKAWPTRMGLIHWSELRRRALAALQQLSIDWLDPATPMARLSGGDKMLVKIAAALVGEDGAEPIVYVMDEPTAALNEAESRRLFAVIDQLKTRGAAILYVSHRMDEVMRLSDRISVLRDGRHVATRLRSQTDAAQLIEDMTGRSFADAFPRRTAAPSTETALALENLRTTGIAPVTLSVSRGEILGIAGLAGSGQSELLETIMGARRAEGSMRMAGKAAFLNRDPAEAWANGFAFVPRERRAGGIVGTASIVANTALAHLSSLARGRLFAHQKAETALAARLADQVRLKHASLSQPIRQLSGGNQQKVVLARAIAGEPDILVLDEPTRGVDVGAKFDIHGLLRDLAASGMAVIMASTDLPELIGMSDRIAIMADGRLADIVSAEGLDQATLLALLYHHQPIRAGGPAETRKAHLS